MKREAWVKQLSKSIDDKNTEAFKTFLADNVVFRFGNAAPVSGKKEVGDVVGGFFGSIKALHHEVTEICEQKDCVVFHGFVTYTRHNSTTLRVPFANFFKMEADLIKDYLIFIDISELYKG